MEPTLLPVKPGTLTKQDKAALRKAGVVVVEHENPAELRLLKPSAEIGTGGLLYCALQALMKQGQYSDSGALQRETFAKLVAQFVKPPEASNENSSAKSAG